MGCKRLNILTIFGTRPEVIKLFPVLEKLKQDNIFKSTTACTAQHREMIDDLLKLFSIKPTHDLNIIQKNQSLTDISARALAGLDLIMKRHQPDLILVQGDTTTAFIGALTAFYHKIPVGHIEAGLRSFNKMHPYPEEINRRLISVVCDLHFSPTFQNAQNLKREGVDPERIFVTGNTVTDSLLYIVSRDRNTLNDYLPVDALNSHRLILVTAHRRENWGKPLENLCEALKDLTQAYPDIRIIYPVHLNPNVRETVFKILRRQERIYLLDPLAYEPFVEAMAKAYVIITDSGGIQEEGPSLHKPILVFRKLTERPEGLATGCVKLVGLGRESVIQETSHLLDDPEAYQCMTADGNSNPYGDGRSAERVVQAILYHFGRGARPQDFGPQIHGALSETAQKNLPEPNP
jgi:UDP-N-acetylglucosamine 2-epimerase (non-hydrolysing)